MKHKNQILTLRAEGKSYDQICRELNCSKSIVAYHCSESARKKQSDRQKKLRKENVLLKKVDNFKQSKHGKKNQPIHTTTTKQLQWHKVRKYRERKSTESEEFSYKDVVKKFGEQTACYLTGRPIDLKEPRLYQFDHIVPVSRGGKNTLSNLGIACKEANIGKSNLLLDEFIQLCKDVLEHHGYNIHMKEREEKAQVT